MYKLNFSLSHLERQLFRYFEDMLESRGFSYLSIPSLMRAETLKRQEIDVTSLGISKEQLLTGSAEQGILEYFTGQEVGEMRIYAKNQCFRVEPKYEGLVYCKEFLKLEQFCFTTEDKWKETFRCVMQNVVDFLEHYGVEYRIVEMTDIDKGYHLLKHDVQVKTKQYGWLETHSCTYFGEEQTKRYGITGTTHTISNTGVASPRILIPFIEKLEASL